MRRVAEVMRAHTGRAIVPDQAPTREFGFLNWWTPVDEICGPDQNVTLAWSKALLPEFKACRLRCQVLRPLNVLFMAVPLRVPMLEFPRE